MDPGEFEYLRAESVAHALDLLEEYPDPAVLAGGHTLLPDIELGLADPDTVVDIGTVDAMRGIERGSDVMHIGALTTYGELLDTDALRDRATVLTEAVGEIGDTQVRNRATVGGNLVRPEPTSDLSAAIIASDATLVATSRRGERRIDADDFFRPMRTTALDEDELLTRIDVPLVSGDGGGAYSKTQSPSARYTLVGVAARVSVDDRLVSTARVAANGVTNHGIRLTGVEDALEGKRFDTETIAAAAARATVGIDESQLIDDNQASATFRTQLLEVYTQQALERTAKRTGVTVPA
jgi:carbon-monoxide dehydrogenase medium subunit